MRPSTHARERPSAGTARATITSRSPSGAVDHEARLDQGLGGPGPDDGRVGPAAQHQLERLDHQRLAGAGLAGQDRHARHRR